MRAAVQKLVAKKGYKKAGKLVASDPKPKAKTESKKKEKK